MQLSHVIFNTAFFSLKLSKPELVLILLYGQLTYAEIKEETLQSVSVRKPGRLLHSGMQK